MAESKEDLLTEDQVDSALSAIELFDKEDQERLDILGSRLTKWMNKYASMMEDKDETKTDVLNDFVTAFTNV